MGVWQAKRAEMRARLALLLGALSGEDPFARDDGLPSIIMDNIAWAAENSDEQIIAERERVTSEIEADKFYEWNDSNYNADPSTAWVLR